MIFLLSWACWVGSKFDLSERKFSDVSKRWAVYEKNEIIKKIFTAKESNQYCKILVNNNYICII